MGPGGPGGAVTGGGRRGERRVLYYLCYPQRMAGANRSQFHLVTHLPPEVRPLVVLSGEGAVAEAYREAGIEVRILPLEGLIGSYGKEFFRASRVRRLRAAATELLPYGFRLRALIREFGAHLVHANDPRAALLAAPGAWLAGVPLVAHLRGEFVGDGTLRAVYERASRRIVCVSDGARATLGPRGRAKAVTVYNGIGAVPPPARRLPGLEAERAAGRVVVGCFASVVPFKGHHHLVRAAALLNERGWRDRVRFVCVGDLMPEYAAYQEWVRRLAAELGVDNVTFTGWQDDPFSFYSACDLSVLPSVSTERLEIDGEVTMVQGNEGFPRTHLEAMSLGIPVVGTRIAGVPEQVEDGVSGLLADPADPAGLARALEALLASPERRRTMGEAARERVRRLFSTEAYVEGVMRVYDEVDRKRAPR